MTQDTKDAVAEQATSRPWGYETTELSEGMTTAIYDSRGMMIADHLDEHRAALICRAVNRNPLFDELVSALTWCAINDGECLGDHTKRLVHYLDLLARVKAAARTK